MLTDKGQNPGRPHYHQGSSLQDTTRECLGRVYLYLSCMISSAGDLQAISSATLHLSYNYLKEPSTQAIPCFYFLQATLKNMGWPGYDAIAIHTHIGTVDIRYYEFGGSLMLMSEI